MPLEGQSVPMTGNVSREEHTEHASKELVMERFSVRSCLGTQPYSARASLSLAARGILHSKNASAMNIGINLERYQWFCPNSPCIPFTQAVHSPLSRSFAQRIPNSLSLSDDAPHFTHVAHLGRSQETPYRPVVSRGTHPSSAPFQIVA